MTDQPELPAPRIRITYDGREVWTTAMAAAQLGMAHDTLRKAIQREAVVPMPVPLDGRTPLYEARELARIIHARPGRGANLRGPRSASAATAE